MAIGKRICEKTGKVMSTRETASYAMFELAQLAPSQNLNVYKCEHCKAYHVGHTPLRVRQRYPKLFRET